MMRPPVGQLATGVLIPPTELVMAVGVRPGPALVAVPVLGGWPLEETVIDRRSRAQPAIPVEFLRHLGNRESTVGGSPANRGSDPLDFPHPTGGH